MSIKNGQIFNENFLMSIAAIGAFDRGVRRGCRRNAVLPYRRGFRDLCSKQVEEIYLLLMELRPDHANVMFDGEMRTTDPEDVEVGQLTQ